MTKLFAVIRTRGAAWQAALSIEEQEGWAAHAAFMDGLAKEGFIVLAGPLEGTNDVLLIACAGADCGRRRRSTGCGSVVWTGPASREPGYALESATGFALGITGGRV